MTFTIDKLAKTLQTLFTTEADTAAKESGMIQRRRKISGAGFVQSLAYQPPARRPLRRCREIRGRRRRCLAYSRRRCRHFQEGTGAANTTRRRALWTPPIGSPVWQPFRIRYKYIQYYLDALRRQAAT